MMLRWLTLWRRLMAAGTLSMNERNVHCCMDGNARELVALVDDKHRMHDLCRRIGVPTPQVLAILESHECVRNLQRTLVGLKQFVLKPKRGASGRGVLVVVDRAGDWFLRSTGETLHLGDLATHATDTLSGAHSLGGRPDSVLVQELVRVHPVFAQLAHRGTPDIRVIVYRGHFAMAMLRLPTAASSGRANLHQGGIGVGVDLDSGVTTRAIQFGQSISTHPDTGASLIGFTIPHWRHVLDVACRVARATGLGYVGMDLVLDEIHGPMLMEANARPGLAIQLANGRGLRAIMQEIDRGPITSTSSVSQRVFPPESHSASVSRL